MNIKNTKTYNAANDIYICIFLLWLVSMNTWRYMMIYLLHPYRKQDLLHLEHNTSADQSVGMLRVTTGKGWRYKYTMYTWYRWQWWAVLSSIAVHIYPVKSSLHSCLYSWIPSWGCLPYCPYMSRPQALLCYAWHNYSITQLCNSSAGCTG